MNLLYIFCIILIQIDSIYLLQENLQLKSISVIMRHGKRETINDMRNSTEDQLTNLSINNVGKLQGFEMGMWLRQRYPQLIQSYYVPEEIFARSSYVSRSEMTAQTFLAGLYYPLNPKDEWSGKYNIAWSPIPVIYAPRDEILYPNRDEYCPALAQILNATEVYIYKKYPSTQLPWDVDEYLVDTPEHEEIIDDSINYLHKYPIWNRLFSGPLLEDILQQIQLNKTKLNLYAGHDATLIGVINSLDFEKKNFRISFVSTLIFELYTDKDTGNEFVKIIFKNGLKSEMEVQKMRQCEELCPLNKFQSIIEPMIPRDWNQECQTTVHLQQ